MSRESFTFLQFIFWGWKHEMGWCHDMDSIEIMDCAWSDGAVFRWNRAKSGKGGKRVDSVLMLPITQARKKRKRNQGGNVLPLQWWRINVRLGEIVQSLLLVLEVERWKVGESSSKSLCLQLLPTKSKGEDMTKPQKVAPHANTRKRKKEAPHGKSRFPHPPTGAVGSVIISMQPRARLAKIWKNQK